MRIVAAELSHETNTFSSVPTDLAAFERAGDPIDPCLLIQRRFSRDHIERRRRAQVLDERSPLACILDQQMGCAPLIVEIDHPVPQSVKLQAASPNVEQVAVVVPEHPSGACR